MLKELYEHLEKIEQILATIEELSDKKALKRIKKSQQEIKTQQYTTTLSPDKIRDTLLKD
jgi:predicted ArsR family transcriptional regulator